MTTTTITTWEATKAAYQAIKGDRSNYGVVKVTALTDAVMAATGLSRSDYHSQLLVWRAEDKIVLQLCNDRYLEPKAAEGIETPRGLLFYVQMR